MDRHDVPAAALKPKRSPARRCVSAAFWLLYVAVLLEVVARGYWAYFCDVPFFDSSQVLVGRFYPELNTSGVLTESITRDDEYFDVLLLGGSVLTDEYGTIEANLRKRLGQLTEHRVRVFNLAACGHTSRDSLIKYRMLDEQKFDLVVVYETINETRLNNCPPEMFRADYTHASWYDRIERLKTHPELRYCVFPYTLEYTAVGVLEARCFGRYIPRHAPDDHLWYEYGADVKTAATFRANVEEIVAYRASAQSAGAVAHVCRVHSERLQQRADECSRPRLRSSLHAYRDLGQRRRRERRRGGTQRRGA